MGEERLLGSCADYLGCSGIDSAATRPPTKWHNFNKISDATGLSPRNFENLAETLGAFVALASIQLALRRLARA